MDYNYNYNHFSNDSYDYDYNHRTYDKNNGKTEQSFNRHFYQSIGEEKMYYQQFQNHNEEYQRGNEVLDYKNGYCYQPEDNLNHNGYYNNDNVVYKNPLPIDNYHNDNIYNNNIIDYDYDYDYNYNYNYNPNGYDNSSNYSLDQQHSENNLQHYYPQENHHYDAKNHYNYDAKDHNNYEVNDYITNGRYQTTEFNRFTKGNPSYCYRENMDFENQNYGSTDDIPKNRSKTCTLDFIDKLNLFDSDDEHEIIQNDNKHEIIGSYYVQNYQEKTQN